MFEKISRLTSWIIMKLVEFRSRRAFGENLEDFKDKINSSYGEFYI